MNKMKILDGFVALIEMVFSKVNKEPIFTEERMYALNDCLEELDDLRAQIKLEDITQSKAEMMVEHKDGTVEYIKDIGSIMLLADKDYHITYTGEF